MLNLKSEFIVYLSYLLPGQIFNYFQTIVKLSRYDFGQSKRNPVQIIFPQ